ncbi:hypothetical protein ABEF95_006989 [Exophiala dermatitidis]
MESAKKVISNIVGSGNDNDTTTGTTTRTTGTGATDTIGTSHNTGITGTHPTDTRTYDTNTSSRGTGAGAYDASSSTAATHHTTPSSLTGTHGAPTVHDIITEKGVESGHSHEGGLHHGHQGTQEFGTGQYQGGSHQTAGGAPTFGGSQTLGGTQTVGGTTHQHHQGQHHHEGTGNQQFGTTTGTTGTTHQHHEGAHHHEGTQQFGTTTTQQHHEGGQHLEGESTSHHEGGKKHHVPIPGLHKDHSKDKESGASSESDRNVQSPDQGPDPALVGDRSGGVKLTGTAEPGSHSAVFGLTPDGHKETKTSHKSTPPVPADQLGKGHHHKAERNDDSSRAPTGQGVSEQLHRPETGPKGLERTDPAPGAPGSDPKPGAGTASFA